LGDFEFDEFTSEISADDDDDQDDTLNDADSENLLGDPDNNNLEDYVDMEKFLAYLPCAAHNFQLVLKDAFKLDTVYDELLKRVTSMVTKSKQSSVVAEQLRNLDKFLCKNVITRWNSILFLVRSILKLSTAELQQIRSNMPTKNKKQQMAKELFRLTQKDREMLSELRDLLVLFEFVTNELQTNEISISRVYPCYLYLKQNLLDEQYKYNYTKKLRQDLGESLEKRFFSLIQDNEIFILSTLLDPFFGKRAIPLSERDSAVAKLKNRLINISSRPINNNESAQTKISAAETARKNNYLFFGEVESSTPLDDLDSQIKEYFSLIERNEYSDALLFWKTHHQSPSFVNMAKLAKKMLGVPATSASVERMFSLSGHILGPKRRTTGVQLYEDLVYLKLNEDLFDYKVL